MAAITSENRDAWQAIANEVSKDRPSVGKTVEIIKGRKHKGKVGVVVYHGINKFVDAFRYASDAQAIMREMSGRYGYVVKVKTDSGETFFVDADYTKIL